MTKLTSDQIAFARTMTERQWAVLGSLTIPYHLSASERADPEIWALIRNKLAYTYPGVVGVQALYMWRATDEGEALIKQRWPGAKTTGSSPRCAGPTAGNGPEFRQPKEKIFGLT